MNTTQHERCAYDQQSWFCVTHNALEQRIEGVHYSEIESTLNAIDLFNLDTDEAKANVAIVREFVSQLLSRVSKRDSYKAPAIAGIANLEDDFTFIQWVIATRELLWH